MPYYNQLYESAKLEFNPFNDVDLTRKHLLNFDGKTNTKDSGTRNTNTNDTGTNYRLFSDTPQGALTGVDNENYLTDATKTTNNDETNTNESTNTSGSTDTTNTENYIETIVGKQGTENYSSLLQKFRDTFLNIDLMVIEEFNDLFLNLW